ncbi:hypothetical protein AXG93_3733s1000 [Marchantia polymorpha subsp. ruderalis]|uniref:Uncharacterized protein n=1 Tax=Marchantia polymorpha subsp. ruderalis TaxID=1480154 RepID=A0A176WFK3_MARPO|nr:hypothetical protein AXG93_3733s1000 [Marchantia polymorpha subsp. ruderalis]
MKARRLILEADSSTESRATVSRGRPTREAGAEVNTVREKEAPTEKGPRTSEVRLTTVASSRTTRKDKGKDVLIEEVPPTHDEVSLAGIKMKTPLKRIAEVLAVLSDSEEDPTALEEVVARAVEGAGGAECGPLKDLPLLQYLNRKQEKYAEATTNGTYVEIVRNRTRTKVAAAFAVVVKECRNQSTEAKLEACRSVYNAESLRVDELTATAEKEQEYEAELAAKAKCEGARILDLELIEKLETECSELMSQRTQAEEQLCEMETRLWEAEEKNWQFVS